MHRALGTFWERGCLQWHREHSLHMVFAADDSKAERKPELDTVSRVTAVQHPRFG